MIVTLSEEGALVRLTVKVAVFKFSSVSPRSKRNVEAALGRVIEVLSASHLQDPHSQSAGPKASCRRSVGSRRPGPRRKDCPPHRSPSPSASEFQFDDVKTSCEALSLVWRVADRSGDHPFGRIRGLHRDRHVVRRRCARKTHREGRRL